MARIVEEPELLGWQEHDNDKSTGGSGTSSTQRTGRLQLGDLDLMLRLSRVGIHGEGRPV